MSINRGSDVSIRISDIQTGQIVRTINANSATWATDGNTERQKRLGTRRKPIRQTLDGHSGTLTFEIENLALLNLEDRQIDAYRNGDPEYKIDIIRTYYLPRQRVRSTYVYPNAMFTLNEDNSEQDAASTQTVNWMSELREHVNGPRDD